MAGGSASAFFIFNKSPKIQYLMAEATSLKLMGELYQDRYTNEMKWIDVQKKKPVETIFDLSAEWNDPNVGYIMEEVQSVVNSSKLLVKSVLDPVNDQAEFEVSAELGSLKERFGTLYATPEKLLLSLPFSEELIRFDDNDFGRLMRESDEEYEGPDSLGLPKMFEDNPYSTGELNTYLRKEYLEYIYKELPDTAFKDEKEKVVVFDNEINAKKLTMSLTEEQVKTLVKKVLKKARDDEKLKSLLKEELAMSSISGNLSAYEMTDFFNNYESGFDEAIDGIDEMSLSEGIRSTIWHHSNRIVKREFSMKIGEYEDEESAITIKGTQLVEKDQQKWKYTFAGTDSYDEEQTVTFNGDLTWKDGKADDSMTVDTSEGKLIYKGEEKLDGKKRTFKRTFGISDGESEPEVVWTGNATHEKDSMKAKHVFSLSNAVFDEGNYSLNLNQQAKIVKKVKRPAEDSDTVVLKDMSIDEIETYVTEDLAVKMQSWIMDLMGNVESEIYN